jgi:DNA helicase HerA-like ATPase
MNWGQYKPPDVVLIIGMPGSGKTTDARGLAEKADRVFYVDPAGDYRADSDQVTLDELVKSPEILAPHDCRVSLALESESDQDLAQEVTTALALACAAGDFLIVLDEVGDYKKCAEGPLGRLARKGRHSGIVSIWVSQFATDIPRTVRRAATEVRCFAQSHPDDLDALEECYGPDFRAQVEQWQVNEAPAVWRLPATKSRAHHRKAGRK